MSSMADFAGALGGGGPPPGLGPGGPPVDLGAGGGPPVDLGAAAGPPPPDQGTQVQGTQYQSSLDALDGAEEALHAFIQLDPDEADRAVAAQCLQNVLKLKAGNQKAQQSGDMKGLARALQGAGAGGGDGGGALAGLGGPPAGPGGY